MHITKKETKLMAFVTAFVMMLSCLVVIPTESKAAGTAPTVSVLGASLRMDAETGKQSMRIGVQVENASQAKACGVELTIGSKTIKIATDGDGEQVLKGDKIYEYDAAKDTILYTAVITNIPKDSFSTAISAKGSATPMEGEAVVSEAVTKSVTDVVDGIKQNLPDVEMLDDGTLVNGTIATLDTSNADSIKAHGTQNNFYNWTEGANAAGDAAVEYDSTEQALKFTTDTANGRGLTYQTSSVIDPIFSIQVKADESATFQLQGYFGGGGPSYSATGDYQTITEKVSLKAYEARALTLTPAGTYYVKSCTLYRPLTSDDVTMHLPKETVTLSLADTVGGGGDASSAIEKQDDGSILVKNYKFIAVPLKKDGGSYPAGTKLKIAVYGTCAQSNLRGWLEGGTGDAACASNQQQPMEFAKEYTYTATKDATYFEIKVPAWDSPAFTTLHIEKIELTDLT